MKLKKLILKALLGTSIIGFLSCKKDDESSVKAGSIQADAIRQVAILTINFPALTVATAIQNFVIQGVKDPRYGSLTNYQAYIRGSGEPECPPQENCAVIQIPDPNDPPNPIASNIIKPGSVAFKVEIPLSKLPPDIRDQLLAKAPEGPLPDNDPTGSGGDVVPTLDLLLVGKVAQLGLALDGPAPGSPISIQASAPAPKLK